MGRSARWVSWLLLGLSAGVACGEVRRQSRDATADAGAASQDPDPVSLAGGGAAGSSSEGLAGRSIGGKPAVAGASMAGSSTLSSAGLSFGPVPDSPRECPEDCTAAVAYTYDPASMCLSAKPDKFLGCACGRVDSQSEFGCYIDRDSGMSLVTWPSHPGDRSTYALPVDMRPYGVEPCTTDELWWVLYNTSSCDFADCERPVRSQCTLADTLDYLQSRYDDGGPRFPLIDEQGCLRPECDSDSDCDSDERCASAWGVEEVLCTRNNLTPELSCEGFSEPYGMIQHDFCIPMELGGPRGTWQWLRVTAIENENQQPWSAIVDATGAVTPSAGEGYKLPLASLQQADAILRSAYVRGDITVGYANHAPCQALHEFDLELAIDGQSYESEYSTCNDPSPMRLLIEMLAPH